MKALDAKSKDYLLTIFNEIWNNETPPQEWRDGIIVKLPKKGDLGDCNNWRGITLLSSVGKLFCTILLKRIKRRLTVFCEKNRQDSDQEDHAVIKFLF